MTNFKANLWMPIGVGTLLRIILLLKSLPHDGYFGGDTASYLFLAENLFTGKLGPGDFFWGPGFPFILFFLKPFGINWLWSVVAIGICAAFSVWCYKSLRSTSGEKIALLALWFFALEPVWVAYTVIVSPDFLCGVLFSVFSFLTLVRISRNSKWHNSFLLGIGFGLMILIRPMYQWIPLLWFFYLLILARRKTIPLILALSFITGWAIPVGSYRAVRFIQSGDSTLSGHNPNMILRYVKGRMLVAQGLATTSEEGEALTVKYYQERQRLDPSYSPSKDLINFLADNPVHFLKLFSISAFRTYFGNSGTEMSKLWSNHPTPAPGLWMTLVQGGSLSQKLLSLPYFYLAIAALTFFWRFVLLGAALYSRKGTEFDLRDFFIVLGILYFGATPLVLGESRFFLPIAMLVFMLCKPKVSN